MDAYVYVRTTPGEARRVGEEIAHMDSVRQVSLITGEWDLLVALKSLDAFSLGPTVIDEIQKVSGIVQTSTAPVIPLDYASQISGPRYPTIHFAALVALVHIHVHAGHGLEVFQALDAMEHVAGIAALAGPYDILCEVGGGSWEEIASILVNEISQVEGIESTTTSLAVAKLKSAETAG